MDVTVELIIVCTPLTCRLPRTTTSPESVPIGVGSMYSIPLDEAIVLSSILILSTSTCVRPANTVEVPPALIAVEPIVVAFVTTTRTYRKVCSRK